MCSSDLPGSQSGTETIGKWVLKGYQADIDFANQYTGQLYEERGRGFLALRGAFGYFGPSQAGPRGPVAALEGGDALKAFIKQNDWNQLQIIARGNTLVHLMNGKVISVTIDDNPDFRAFQGILSLQLEGSGQIWYRNVYVKPL